MKYNESLVSQVREGKLAVHNINCTKEELQELIAYIFPKSLKTSCDYKYYYKSAERQTWYPNNNTTLLYKSVKEFLEEEFVLPEKWCIKAKNKEEAELICPYANKKQGEWNKSGNGGWNDDNIMKYYLNIRNYEYHYSSKTIEPGYTEITFDQFCKYVIKKNNMKEQFPIDDFGIIIENNNGEQILDYLVNKGFINKKNYDGSGENNSYYYILKDKKGINCDYINKTSKTYTLEQLKQLENNMEKEIIGYKLIKSIYRDAVTKIISTMKEDIVTDKASIFLLKEAGVIDIWFEKVYAPEKPIEIIVDMGNFQLKVTKEGIFHKSENITKFVEELHNTYTKLPSKFGSYDCIVDEITFKKTGCESNVSSLKQWVTTYQEYLKLKN